MDINTRPNPGGCAPLPDRRSIPSLADIESSGPDERSSNDASQTAADGDVSDTDEWFKEMNKKRKSLRYIEMDFNDPDIEAPQIGWTAGKPLGTVGDLLGTDDDDDDAIYEPTAQPTFQPTSQPTFQPTFQPTLAHFHRRWGIFPSTIRSITGTKMYEGFKGRFNYNDDIEPPFPLSNRYYSLIPLSKGANRVLQGSHYPTPTPEPEGEAAELTADLGEKKPGPGWIRWTEEEIEILILTAEAGISWAETMPLLPNRTRDSALEKMGRLRQAGLWDSTGKRRPFHSTTANGVLDKIVQLAREAPSEAAKKAVRTDAKAETEQRQAREDVAPELPARPKKEWTLDDDEKLLRLYLECKDDSYIVGQLPGKGQQAMKKRLKQLIHGPDENGVEGPSETYARVHKEYHPGVDIARE